MQSTNKMASKLTVVPNHLESGWESNGVLKRAIAENLGASSWAFSRSKRENNNMIPQNLDTLAHEILQ